MNNRILIIDDDKELCTEIGEILEDEGYEVTLTGDGRSGLELLQSEFFSLVFLDLKIPGMPGAQVLERIRESNIPVKVLVITGSFLVAKGQQELSHEQKRIVEFADGILGKPCDIELLLNETRRLTTGNKSEKG
ncbi:MAG: response regulator [Candidatus Omnitrophica bacterium]|nr:response regulator [Candidatus Omnitrophota bacterium]